jgi:hypothetical protein
MRDRTIFAARDDFVKRIVARIARRTFLRRGCGAPVL